MAKWPPLAVRRRLGAVCRQHCDDDTPRGDREARRMRPRGFNCIPSSIDERTRDLVAKAEAAGCRAVCLTVDTPIAGIRNREQRAGVRLPRGITAPYFHHVVDAQNVRTTLHATHVARCVVAASSMTSATRAPEGCINAEDADRAGRRGSERHGCLEPRRAESGYAAGNDRCAPEVADAVGGRIPILLDGGVRRGTDVLKAIALGASAVMIGRPYLFGLAVAGAAGVDGDRPQSSATSSKRRWR